MKKLLNSGWMLALVGSLTYLATTATLMISGAKTLSPKTQSHETGEKLKLTPKDLASWNYINPDIDELTRQLKDKRAELDEREKELEKVAAQIANEKRELAGVTNWVNAIQSEIDVLFSRVEAEEAANMKEIITVYQKMDPPDLAKMLYEYDDRRIAKIFKFLKQTEVSSVIKVWLGENSDQKLKRVHKILDHYHRIILPPSANS